MPPNSQVLSSCGGGPIPVQHRPPRRRRAAAAAGRGRRTRAAAAGRCRCHHRGALGGRVTHCAGRGLGCVAARRRVFVWRLRRRRRRRAAALCRSPRVARRGGGGRGRVARPPRARRRARDRRRLRPKRIWKVHLLAAASQRAGRGARRGRVFGYRLRPAGDDAAGARAPHLRKSIATARARPVEEMHTRALCGLHCNTCSPARTRTRSTHTPTC